MTRLRWWALATASVGVLILLSAQQTGAMWHDSTPISNATIRSGTLALAVGDASSQSAAYTLSAFGGTNLTQNAAVQQPLTVANAGSVDMNYRLDSVSQTTTTTNVPLRLAVWLNPASCPSTGAPTGGALIYDGAMNGAAAPTTGWAPALAPGAKSTWCLRATVGSLADGFDVAQSSTVTFHFTANS